jgi:hypothetical protein
MGRKAAGVIVGAAVYFIWGMVSWMVLPWHDKTIKPLPEEQLITDTLKIVVTEPGMYFFPSDRKADGAKIEEAAWSEKYKQGPVGVMAYSREGMEPMSPGKFVRAFIMNLVLAFLALTILSLCRDRVQGFIPRGLLVGLLGLLAGLATHGSYWNWFNFPLDFTVVGLLDETIGFTLMGLALAKFTPRDQ